MLITYRGSAICSYNLLIRYAILKVTVPATIITSLWRGVARGTMPSLSISYGDVPVLMNSIAQQAIPNVMGNKDDSLDQLNRLSTWVTMTPLFPNDSRCA